MTDIIEDYAQELEGLIDEIDNEIIKVKNNKKMKAEVRSEVRGVDREDVFVWDEQRMAYLEGRIARTKQVYKSYKLELRDLDKIQADPYKKVVVVFLLSKSRVIWKMSFGHVGRDRMTRYRKEAILMRLSTVWLESSTGFQMKVIWREPRVSHIVTMMSMSSSLTFFLTLNQLVIWFDLEENLDHMTTDQVLIKASKTQDDSLMSLDRTLMTIEDSKQVRFSRQKFSKKMIPGKFICDS